MLQSSKTDVVGLLASSHVMGYMGCGYCLLSGNMTHVMQVKTWWIRFGDTQWKLSGNSVKFQFNLTRACNYKQLLLDCHLKTKPLVAKPHSLLYLVDSTLRYHVSNWLREILAYQITSHQFKPTPCVLQVCDQFTSSRYHLTKVGVFQARVNVQCHVIIMNSVWTLSSSKGHNFQWMNVFHWQIFIGNMH